MPAALQEQITPSECGMGIYRLHGFFGLFPSVLPFLFIIFCPFPFPVLFLGFVCALFVLMFFFRLSLFSCMLLFLFLDCLSPFILFYCFLSFSVYFSFLFAVCYSFPSPLLSSLFPFVLFPFSFSLSFHVIFLLSSSRPFCFWMFLVFFSLVYNFGETYYIILCACSFTSLHPLLTHVFFLLHDLRRGQTHG